MRSQAEWMDHINYVNDSRNRTFVPVPDHLPTRWAICDSCTGNGTMVNPSIDAGGLSVDMQDNHEFMQDYMSGQFDVPCNQCGGSGKVKEIDRDRADFAEQIAEYDQEVEDHYASEAESRAERMMGA